MAVTIPSVGSTAETASNIGATTANLSPGLPATRANGDILLCLTVGRSGSSTVSVSTSGWAQILNVSGTNGRIALFACKVDGTEVGPTVAWASLTTGTSGNGAAAQIAAVRGLDFTVALASLAHQTSAAQNQAASSTIQAMGATITPTLPNSAIFSLAVRQDNDVTDANWPVIATGNNITWAKVAAVLNSASGADFAQSFQFGQQGAATAIAAKTVTVSGGSSDASSAVLVSLLTAVIKSLTAAAETDAAQALSFTQQAQSKNLTAAASTEAAQALDYELVQGDQQKTITAAAETDAAGSLASSQTPQTKNLAAAAESGSASTLATTQNPQTKTLTAAAETGAAQTLAFTQQPQARTLTAGAETDAAQTLSLTQQPQTPTFTAAAETNTAAALSSSQTPQTESITPAVETDIATDLDTPGPTFRTLVPATSTNTAVALVFSQTPQTATIVAASATDAALPLTSSQAPQTVTLTHAVSTNTAGVLVVAGAGPAATAIVTSGAGFGQIVGPRTGGVA